VIACPTSPVPAFKLGEKTGDPLQMYLTDVFTVTANIAAIPALSIPCGFTSGQRPLPIGLQLLGPVFSEPTLLRIGRMYEKATDWHTRRPGDPGTPREGWGEGQPSHPQTSRHPERG
jgi:aspartyl-tRNA(Asn)/glutamyl-tRNA(Gln) amidotransferase subunit A